MKIAIWPLRFALGLVFFYVATTKLTGTGNTIEYFAAIGWGQWFRYLTGSVDLVGAVLLLVPVWTWLGAIMLTCSAGTATLISLTDLRGNPDWGSPVMVVIPLILTLLALLLAWSAHPQRAA